MSAGAGYPFSVNGNTYNAIDFAGYNYTGTLPRLFGDLAVTSQQIAADRAAIKAALDTNGNLLIPATQARLDYANNSTLILRQAGGNFLWINGLNRPVPGGGVTLSNAGLSAGSFYYVYAYMNGATMVLEALTTAPVLGSSGVQIKNGDATRTLVGMVGMDTGNVFADSPAKRLVVSRYNQPPRPLEGSYNTANTTSTSNVELSTAFRVVFVAFSDNMIDITAMGGTFNSTAGGGNTTYAGIDGSAVGMFTSMTSGSGGQGQVALGRAMTRVSDGIHTGTVIGSVSGGTGSWAAKVVGSIS